MQVLLMRQRCGGCGAESPAWTDVCSGCGVVLHPPGRLRAAGVLYLVLGSLLTGGATYLIVQIAGMVALSADRRRRAASPAPCGSWRSCTAPSASCS
jgi:hypothetical protein